MRRALAALALLGFATAADAGWPQWASPEAQPPQVALVPLKWDSAPSPDIMLIGADEWVLTWGWAAQDGDSGGEVAVEDGATRRFGADALQVSFAEGADHASDGTGDGAVQAGWGGLDWTSYTDFGVWVRSSAALAAGDLLLTLTDSTDDFTVPFPAVAAGTWTWVDLDVSAMAGTVGDAVDDVAVTLGADKGAFTLWLDSAVLWDAASHEAALGLDLLGGRAGVLSALSLPQSAGDPHAFTARAEGSDYWVVEREGDDALLLVSPGGWTTDDQAWVVLVAYQ